jgi:hypothetical protein
MNCSQVKEFLQGTNAGAEEAASLLLRVAEATDPTNIYAIFLL